MHFLLRACNAPETRIEKKTHNFRVRRIKTNGIRDKGSHSVDQPNYFIFNMHKCNCLICLRATVSVTFLISFTSNWFLCLARHVDFQPVCVSFLLVLSFSLSYLTHSLALHSLFFFFHRWFLLSACSFLLLLSLALNLPYCASCRCPQVFCRVSQLSYGELLLLPLLWFISLKTLQTFAYTESKRSIRRSSTTMMTTTPEKMTTVLRISSLATTIQSNRVNHEEEIFMTLFKLATVL